MRKSFTRFLSVLMLFCAFGLQAAFAQSFNGAGSIPKDDDTNVKPGDIATQFVLAFSDTPAITATGGTLVIYKGGDIFKLVPITKTSADVSVVGKTLVVKHGIASFTEGTTYKMVLAPGAVTVGANSAYIPDGAENFTIGDFTAPKLVTSTTPKPLEPVGAGVQANLTVNGSTNLPFTLTMRFDEPVAKGTGDIAVYNTNGTVMDLIKVTPDNALVTVAGNVVTINVNDNSYFGPQSNYYVKVDAGTFVDASVNKNKYVGIDTKTAWTFSTRDNTAPAITATITDVTDGTAKLNISISEAGKVQYKVQAASVANPAADDYTGFTALESLGANTNKTYNLTLPLGGVEYEVFVVAQNSENPVNISAADGKRVTFTTLDNTGPVASNRGSILTDKKTSGVFILFDEKVVGGTGNLAVRKMSDNTLMFSIPASAVASTKITSGVDINKWKAVIDFGGTLASNEGYYVVFPAGYIKDASVLGNAYGDDSPGIPVPVNYPPAGVTVDPLNTDYWPLVSADFEAPVATIAGPAQLNGNVTITFNEEVVLADGSGWPWEGDFVDWSKYVAFQKNGVTVPATYTYAAKVLTIDPYGPDEEDGVLTSNTTYSVVLRPSAVKDISSNANVLVAAQTKEFTTGDLDVLHATFGPGENLNDYTPLTISFNKAVRAIKSGSPAYEALGSSNIKATLKLEKTVNAVTTTVDPNDYSAVYDAVAKKITVTPVNGKPFATSSATSAVSYTLSIVADKIEDNGGTDVEEAAGATTSMTWAVNDYKKPVATLMANEVLNEGALAYLTISFDEVVTAVDATDPFAFAILKMVDAQGNNISFTPSWDGNEMRLTPEDPAVLAVGKTLYYGIGASYEDEAGNVNNGVYKSVKIVGPTVPPVIAAVSYTVNGSASTPINQTLTGVTKNNDGKIIVKVTFDVNIDDENLGLPVVTSLLAAPGEFTIADTDVSGKILTLTITPTEIPANEQGTEHTIVIPVNLVEANEAYTNTPVPTFADMASAVTIKIKTKDTQRPTITSAAPWSGGVVAVDAELPLVFSEDVAPVAGKTITIKYGPTGTETVAETISITSANVVKDGANNKWKIKPAKFNQYNTLYSVIIAKDAFADAANNDLGTNQTFTFTTVANTFAGVKTLVPADNADLVATSTGFNIEFKEEVAKGLEGATRKVIYVIEKKGANADYTIDLVSGDLVLASGGDDVVQGYTYVDDPEKVTISGATVTISGVTLAADKEYYVLITPGAFKDKALPTAQVAYYGGITSYGDWNFFTKDVYAPTVALSFDVKDQVDQLAAVTSNIMLTFNKAIVNNSGTATITNSSLPLLVKLEKYIPETDTWQNLAYTGTIVDEKVITIDNSSLVILGEMKPDTKYRVSFDGTTFKGKASGQTVGSFSQEFWTTDEKAPKNLVVAFKNDAEVTDVSYNTTDGHVANLKISVTDENSGLANHTAINVYYLKSTADMTLTGAEVKGLAVTDGATKTLNGTSEFSFNFDYKGGMASKTKYFVYAVAEDMAGNLSTVTKWNFTTDDVVKPELAGALPTSFDKDGNIVLVFNEAVMPIEDAKARVIDNVTGITYLMDLVKPTTGTNAEKAVRIVGGEFAQMAPDVASYTVEIDPGMIVDVPRQVGGVDVNAANAWVGIVGTSFVVTSRDQVAPELMSTLPDFEDDYTMVDVNPTFTLDFSEAVNLNSSFVNFLIYEAIDEPTLKLKSASIAVGTPYDILTSANVTGVGTSTITLTTNRALVSGHRYYLVVNDGTFSDLAGNKWDNDTESETPVNVMISVEAKDIVPLPVTFRVPQNGNPFYLPVANPLEQVPSNVCIVFAEWDGISGPEDWDNEHASNYENFYLNANDEYVNTYDLKSNVYLLVDGAPVPFTIYNGYRDRIQILAVGGFNQYKGKTIKYGFVNLYDENGNLNSGAEVTFSIKPDAQVVRNVMFKPGDNDDNATTKINIPVNQIFKIEFSKEGSDNKLYSYHATDEGLNNLIVTPAWLNTNGVFTMAGATIAVTAVDFVDGKTVVTIAANAALTSETTYQLVINANKIQIGQGHDPLPSYTETFITADVKAPMLLTTGTPPSNTGSYLPLKSGIVGKDQTLALQFDEKVKGVGNIIIHRWDGVAVATVNLAGVNSDNSGKLVIGKPSDIMVTNANFVTNQDYYIEVPAGAIVDLAAAANPFAGIITVNEWKISLRDDTTPQVTFVDNTKSGIQVDTKIKLTFDRPVEMGAGWLAIYLEDGRAIDLVRTSTGNTTMTSYDFTLNRNLAANTNYLVELGAGTFELTADNSIKQVQKSIGDWYFSTESNSAPTAIEYSPAKDAEAVALASDLMLTFDMNVKPGTGNIQLHEVQNVGGPIITYFDVTDPTKVMFDGATVTISGGALGLKNNSKYYVIVPNGAITNTSTTPDAWAGVTVPFQWQFTTFSDITAPTAMYSPNGPTAIGLKPADVILKMKFNEKVVAGTGNLIIYNAATNAAVKTIGITSTQVVITDSDSTVTIKPTGTALPEKTSFYVKVDATAIKDKVAGNGFAGVTDNTTWTFATGDFTAPKLNAGYSPLGKIANNHPEFKMTFNEPVKAGTGNIKVYEKATNELVLDIPITDAMISGAVVTVTYTYDAEVGGLNRNTLYAVLVDEGAVTDLAGNKYAGFKDFTDWNFRTGDFATGIDPIDDASQFKVYPNPFVDFVMVDNASKLSKIVVTNIAGQVVKEIVRPTNRIQLNELRSGIYFMSLYNADNVIEKTAKISKR